jgi:sortase (surface protein transpeptidase)
MTATVIEQPRSQLWQPEPPAVSADAEILVLSPRWQFVRAALVVALLLSLSLLVEFVLVSRLQHSATQRHAYDTFRANVAKGTAPVGPTDNQGRELRAGAPVAYLEIPAIGLEQVIGESTTPGVLFAGPGHRRDTPLPGQVGTSVVYGRRAMFGGPFADLDQLAEGDLIRVTTGQGQFNFHVRGVRRAGDPVPAPLAAGSARLLLATAAGPAYLPSGVLRIDADLDGKAVGGAARLVSAADLPAEEQIMANDTRTVWALVLWLQALIALALGAVWAWHRWGKAQTWVVFLPPLLLIGLLASSEAARLLPNLA